MSSHFSFANFAVAAITVISMQSSFAGPGLLRKGGMQHGAATRGVPMTKAMIDYLRKGQRAKFAAKRGRAASGENDQAKDLVEGYVEENIFKLAPLQKVELTGELHPWSDTYWPLYQGQLSARYADPNFQPNPTSFESTKKTFVDSTSVCARENLSPAEKYDLLMGLKSNSPASLTYQAWHSAGSMARDGVVESWMGICHGWAPAAYMLPRPQKAVTLRGADGLPLTFYVSDIKALGTLLWATASSNERFIGGRCNLKKSDLLNMGENARKLHPECWDTNSGTWHKVVLNQLGKNRSFVMDATADYEVWNQPVQAFELEYYSLVTGRVGKIESAVRDYSEVTKDPYASQRDKRRVRKIVGVRMKLVYVSENYPSHSPQPDAHQVKAYDYDLEMDSAGNIIGGEWHQDDHPDFLWTPRHEVKAADGKLYKWHINNSNVSSSWNPLAQTVPQDWSQAAASVSMADQPLSAVVDMLFTLAR